MPTNPEFTEDELEWLRETKEQFSRDNFYSLRMSKYDTPGKIEIWENSSYEDERLFGTTTLDEEMYFFPDADDNSLDGCRSLILWAEYFEKKAVWLRKSIPKKYRGLSAKKLEALLEIEDES